MAISSRKSRAGVEKSSQAPVVSKIDAPSGMAASPAALACHLRPFSIEVTRVFICSLRLVIASVIAFTGSSGSGDITSSMRS